MNNAKHGSQWTFNCGCRCDLCRACNNHRVRLVRESKATSPANAVKVLLGWQVRKVLTCAHARCIVDYRYNTFRLCPDHLQEFHPCPTT